MGVGIYAKCKYGGGLEMFGFAFNKKGASMTLKFGWGGGRKISF